MRKMHLILYCFLILFLLGFNADKKEFRIIKEDGIPVAVNPDYPVPTKNGPKDISTWSTMSEKMKKKIKNLIRFAATKPAFLEIIPMDNGSIMVLRDGKFRHNALINIFDSQGRFIIEKELPIPIQNGLSRGDKLYTIFEDKDGYQFVKRYRLRFINDIQ